MLSQQYIDPRKKKDTMDDSVDSNDAEQTETDKQDCLHLFELHDYAMEPEAIEKLRAYLQAGGEQELAINSLSSSYEGLPQMANLLGCWLADLESPPSSYSASSSSFSNVLLANREAVGSKLNACEAVRECFETVISRMIARVFSSESADKVFELIDGNEGLDWLPLLISHKPWRKLIYELVELYPNCLMLTFAVKLISDAGFQSEISNVSTAAQQLDIFSRVFLSSLEQFLAEWLCGSGENTTAYRKALEELRRIACHSQQTFLYTQALLHSAASGSGLGGSGKAVCAHIAQTLRVALVRQEEGRQQEVAPILLALLQSAADDNDRDHHQQQQQIPSEVAQAMRTMLVKRALNPADIGLLYQAYFEPFPPPADLIRDPWFAEMLIDALFSNLTPRINVEHRPKYIYLLAYAASVGEMWRNGIRVQSKAEIDSTRERLEQLIAILYSPEDLLLSLNELLRLVKTAPVVATGLLHHVKTLLLRDDYLGPQPVHLALLDQITTHHSNLHPRIHEALCQLFDRQCGDVAEIVMSRQKSFIDRFGHLLFSGYVTPVMESVMGLYQQGRLDSSLLRYFIFETLEMIEPPYTKEFVNCFLPLMLDPGVADHMSKNPLAKSFIEEAATKSSSR